MEYSKRSTNTWNNVELSGISIAEWINKYVEQCGTMWKYCGTIRRYWEIDVDIQLTKLGCSNTSTFLPMTHGEPMCLVDTIFICEVIEDVKELFDDFHHLQRLRPVVEGSELSPRLRLKSRTTKSTSICLEYMHYAWKKIEGIQVSPSFNILPDLFQSHRPSSSINYWCIVSYLVYP